MAEATSPAAASDALQALWLAAGIGLVVAGVHRASPARLAVDLLGDDAGGDRPGVTYLRISTVGDPVPARDDRVHRLPLRAARHAAAVRRPGRSTVAQPRARAGARVRPRLGDRGQRVGHGARAGAQCRCAPRASSSRACGPTGCTGSSVVPSVMWALVKVGAHLVQRTGFLLAALAVATAAASQRRHRGAGRPPDRRAALHPPRRRRRHVQGRRAVARRPHARRRAARRGARRRRATCTGGAGASGILLTVGHASRWRRCCRTLFTGDADVRTARRRVALVVLGVLQLPGRLHLRARRRAHGRQRLPRPALVDHASPSSLSLPVFVAGDVVWPVLGHRRRVDRRCWLWIYASGRMQEPPCRVRGDAWMESLSARTLRRRAYGLGRALSTSRPG